jgi:hypothetical protein
VDWTGPWSTIRPFVRLSEVVINVAQESCVETVNDLRETHDKADLDHLLDREVLCERVVRSIIDGKHSGGSLSIANDRRLRIAVQPNGQGGIAQVLQLIIADPDAPTEHHMMWDSVVTAIDDRGRRVCEFGKGRRQPVVAAHGSRKVQQSIRLIGMVCE